MDRTNGGDGVFLRHAADGGAAAGEPRRHAGRAVVRDLDHGDGVGQAAALLHFLERGGLVVAEDAAFGDVGRVIARIGRGIEADAGNGDEMGGAELGGHAGNRHLAGCRRIARIDELRDDGLACEPVIRIAPVVAEADAVVNGFLADVRQKGRHPADAVLRLEGGTPIARSERLEGDRWEAARQDGRLGGAEALVGGVFGGLGQVLVEDAVAQVDLPAQKSPRSTWPLGAGDRTQPGPAPGRA